MEKRSVSEDTQYELYNISQDRSETNNLAKEYPEKVEELKKQIIEEFWRIHVLPRPY